MSKQDELLLTSEEMSRVRDKHYWETGEVLGLRLEIAIAEAQLAKAKPIIEKQLRAELNAEIRIELGSKAFEKGKKQERERIFEEMNKRNLYIVTRGAGNPSPEDWRALKGD